MVRHKVILALIECGLLLLQMHSNDSPSVFKQKSNIVDSRFILYIINANLKFSPTSHW